MPQEKYMDYANRVKFTLEELLRDSFEEERRKLEVAYGKCSYIETAGDDYMSVAGLVDTIAALLVAELVAFGVKPDPGVNQEAKLIRKLIANLLTNLVYGNAQSKRQLCNYPGFVHHVTGIINDNEFLTVFYAALIRNLSWMADNSMAKKLSEIVPALTNAAVKAHKRSDQKCLMAALSALWNLGSHSMENKQAICEADKFLPTVIGLLDCVPANTLMVENASGVLKYACGYIVKRPHLLKQLHGNKLVKQLLILLNSPSFTVVNNALNALSQLAENDAETQAKLLKNQQAMALLEGLRNSAREDIRNSVKQVFTHLNSSPLAAYTYSMPHSARTHGSSRLYYSPRTESSYSGASTLVGSSKQSWNCRPANVYQNGSYAQHDTLPRSMKIFHDPTPVRNNPLNLHLSRGISLPPEENIFLRENDIENEAGRGIPESLLGTRSGSVESLNDEVNNVSWQSSVNTDVVNSAEMSPVSESDLPDSPTEFAAQQVVRRTIKAEEDYYGSLEPVDEVLSRVINSALPKPSTPRSNLMASNHTTPHLPKGIRLQTLPIMEQKLELPRSPDICSDIDFDDSITVEEQDHQPSPPRASASSSVASDAGSSTNTDGSTADSKNGMPSTAGSSFPPHHSQAVKTNESAAPPPRDLMEAMKASSLLQSERTMENVRDASCLYQHRDEDDDGELSDDSYCCTTAQVIALEDLTALPDDVDQAFLAEKLIIDCGSLSRRNRLVSFAFECRLLRSSFSPRTQGSSIPKPSSTAPSKERTQNVKIGLLSAATIKRLSKSRHPLPMVPQKPPKVSQSPNSSKAARVSPFNYKEPARAPNSPEKSQTAGSKLVVTTV